MPNTWFVSDTHFNHGNILKFTDENNNHVRPEFKSVEEMNETMIQNWNDVVQHGDKVYHLGDVTFRYGADLSRIMYRLKGQKRLILGNHDLIKGTNLMQWFQKVSMWRVFGHEGFVCSHVPIPKDQFPHSCKLNVHGHIHRTHVFKGRDIDPSYKNVSVEVIDYTPIPYEEILACVKKL